jgi:hypothetical protein
MGRAVKVGLGLPPAWALFALGRAAARGIRGSGATGPLSGRTEEG